MSGPRQRSSASDTGGSRPRLLGDFPGLGVWPVDRFTLDLLRCTLTDHLNTVRDIARYDSDTDTTTVVNHLVYDAYGNVTSETNSGVESLFLFTARPLDADTGLQNNLNRWYDPSVGRWLSEDPVGYRGGVNLFEYVGDNPLISVDPTGLQNPGQGFFPGPLPGQPHLPGIHPPQVPPAPAPTPGPSRPNARRPGGIGYMWPRTRCCSSRTHHNTGFPATLPPGVPVPQGPLVGQNQTFSYPANPPGPVGGGGAGPCIILVVKCPGSVTVFHFTPGDDAERTLAEFSWPAGCRALVCGGTTSSSDPDTDTQSRCLADDVVKAARRRFTGTQVAIGRSGCGVDAMRAWYVVP